MAAITKKSLEFIVNHVVLPPQLPQKIEDARISRAAERSLIDLLSTQRKGYCQVDRQSSNIHKTWASIEMMLDQCTLLISSDALTADLLVRAFQRLDAAGESCDLALKDFELTSALSQPINSADLS